MDSIDNDAIKNSRCFGVAWDGNVKECKICEAKSLCRQKTEGGGVSQKASSEAPKEKIADTSKVAPAQPRPTPHNDTKSSETKPDAAETKKPKSAAKTNSVEYDDDMPNFKEMELEDLLKLATKKGIDVKSFDKITAANIKRMRITMALKKTYSK